MHLRARAPQAAVMVKPRQREAMGLRPRQAGTAPVRRRAGMELLLRAATALRSRRQAVTALRRRQPEGMEHRQFPKRGGMVLPRRAHASSRTGSIVQERAGLNVFFLLFSRFSWSRVSIGL